MIGRWLKWLFLGVAIGYGARPHRLIGVFLLAFALSCWLFAQPGSLVSYSERPAAAPDPWPAEAQTAWVTLGVALRCHFPMLLFLGEPNYVPSPNPIPWLGIRYDAYACDLGDQLGDGAPFPRRPDRDREEPGVAEALAAGALGAPTGGLRSST